MGDRTELELPGCMIAQLESHLWAMEGHVPKVGFKLSTLNPIHHNYSNDENLPELSCNEFDDEDPDRLLWPDEPTNEHESNGAPPGELENVKGLHLVLSPMAPPLGPDFLYMLISPDH